MAGLVNKWKGKDVPDASAVWFRKRADISLYKALKKKLNKLEGKTSP